MSQAEHLILEALQASVSQDPALLKEAERRFEGWLLEPGFYAVLMVNLECYTSHEHALSLHLASSSVLPSPFYVCTYCMLCMCVCTYVCAYVYACAGV